MEKMYTTASPPEISVAICAITYLRPAGLARLLQSLSELQFVKTRSVAPVIVVVDNDRAGSAREVVEAAREIIHWPVRYEIEPRSGISFARNHAVSLASDCRFIAFIDDDEVADPAWLDELLHAQSRYDAQVVTGPVIPVFETPPPDWVVEGRFFERPRHATGTFLNGARTTNVLIDRVILNSLAGPFDPRFALSGGEDTLLFMQLHRCGARIVWCDEAYTSEYVPISRSKSLGWLLRRSYRVGNSLALCEKAVGSTSIQLSIRGAKGIVRVLQGLLGLVPSFLLGRAHTVRNLAYIARGIGMILGLMGHKFQEYRRANGA